MRRFLPLAALALALAACVHGARGRPSPPSDPVPVLDVVSTFLSRGSGFAVRGRVMTAWHVVEDSGGGAIVSGAGEARLLSFHRVADSDAAEADVEDPMPAGWLVYGLAEAHMGDRLDALGRVDGVTLHFRGECLSVFAGEWAVGQPGRYMRLDCPVIHGMSGGPVLDARGDVVAIVTNRLDGRLIALDVP